MCGTAVYVDGSGGGLVAKSCLNSHDPMEYSSLHSSVHGISQARIWSGLLFPSPGDLPNRGIEPRSPALQTEALSSEPPGIDRCVYICVYSHTQICELPPDI